MTHADENQSDIRAIDQLIDRWIDAHNRGDAEALAEFYAADADLVLINGQSIKGRDAIVAMYDEAIRQLPGNKTSIEVITRQFVSDNVVIDDASWQVIGFLPEGAPSAGLSTTVFKKDDDRWLIQCARVMVPVEQTALDR